MHGAGEPGGAVADGSHAIEQMGRMPRAGADALERLLVRGAGVSERDVMAVSGQRTDEGDCAVDFGRDGHDPDVGPRRRNLGKDRLAGEVTFGNRALGQPQALERLRAAGVAAVKSATALDVMADQSLWERGTFRFVSDHVEGQRPVLGPSWRMLRNPAVIERGAPDLGEHNAYVFNELLGTR